jgi:hypothetical protein
MKRNELVKLASANGIAKANNVKSVVLEAQLKEMGVLKTPGKKTGRKIDLLSKRQIRLAEAKAKAESGIEIKRGRPTVEGSARQIRLAELEAKCVNGELKLGRPVSNDSKRQKRLAELEAKRKAGKLKRGRPSKTQVVEDAINNGKVVLN